MRLLLPIMLAMMVPAKAVDARAPEPPPEIASLPVTLLIDLGSGQVLNARQPDLRFVPASMAKVMTAYVAFEEIAAGRLNERDRLVVRPETARQWKGKGTSMHLGPGETVSVSDLLHGIMTASANDASVVLAEGCLLYTSDAA
ncbi:MAG: serine hydrolase, partial [Alteraurantiacibacter sp.]|nr:serine hydrolase [Alteraurantiacibacter sp.]